MCMYAILPKMLTYQLEIAQLLQSMCVFNCEKEKLGTPLSPNYYVIPLDLFPSPLPIG